MIYTYSTEHFYRILEVRHASYFGNSLLCFLVDINCCYYTLVIYLMDSEVVTVVTSTNDQLNLISNISLYSERVRVTQLNMTRASGEVWLISLDCLFDFIPREKLIVFGRLRRLWNLGFKIYVILWFSFLREMQRMLISFF